MNEMTQNGSHNDNFSIRDVSIASQTLYATYLVFSREGNCDILMESFMV